MRFFLSFVPFFIPVFGLFFSCSAPQAERSESSGSINGPVLVVSNSHRQDFVPLSYSLYEGEGNIDAVFRNLVNLGDRYCSMKYGRADFDSAIAEQMIPGGRLNHYMSVEQGAVDNLRAGCWNFIEMNDYYPDLDFHLVRSLYPSDRFDCYSVGFLQPYIMNSILGCASLTMLDIDWRILEAHHSYIRARKSGKGPVQALSEVKPGWIAYREPFGPGQSLTTGLVCRSIQKEHCEKLILESGKVAVPDNWRLNLAALHDAALQQINGNIPVFFLSNAIEEMYTSKDEFLQLMERTSSILPPGGKALFIHHVGGWKLFGIYELTHKKRENSSYTIKTVCKDPYLALSRSTDGRPVKYVTHFESVSENPDSPLTCGELIQKNKQKK